MKILFFSDIHGIDTNLEVLKKLDERENFDKIVVLGDLYYPGPAFDNSKPINSSVIKDFLTNYQDRLICLRGNCDSDVDVKVSDFPICDDLALIHTDGIDLYCTHGNIYNFEKDDKFQRKGVLIYGHEHFSYIKKKNEMIYINVGSISAPRNNSEASYGIYNEKTFIIYNIDGKAINSITLT